MLRTFSRICAGPWDKIELASIIAVLYWNLMLKTKLTRNHHIPYPKPPWHTMQYMTCTIVLLKHWGENSCLSLKLKVVVEAILAADEQLGLLQNSKLLQPIWLQRKTVAFEGSQMNQSPPARIFSTIQNERSEGLPPHSFPSAKLTSCRNLIHSGVRGWQLSTKTVDSLVHQSTRGKTQNQADSQNNSQKSSATTQMKKWKPFANQADWWQATDKCCNTVTKYKSFQWMLTFAYTFTFSL